MFVSIFAAIFVCFTVTADNDPTFYLDGKLEEKTLNVSVSFTPDVVAAGTIKLSYNTDALTLVSASQGSAEADTILLNTENKGMVVINFLNPIGPVKNNTELARLVFSVNSENLNENDLYAQSFKLYNINSELLSSDSTTNIVKKIESNSPVNSIPEATDSSVAEKPESSEPSDDSSAVSSESSVETVSAQSSVPYESNASSESTVSSTPESKTSIPDRSVDNSETSITDSTSVVEEQSTAEHKSESVQAEESSDAKADDNTSGAFIWLIVGVVAVAAALTAFLIIRKQTGSNENDA